MRCIVLLFTFSFIVHITNAQTAPVPCGCEVLRTVSPGYFANEEAASRKLNEYVDKLWQYSKIRKTDDPFVIRQASCPTPVSEICQGLLPNGKKGNIRLILYNDYFLKRLNATDENETLVDLHVLLHELGHHVLGHHSNGRSIEALQVPYMHNSPNPKLWNKYGADNPMAQEIEADIYAVWALSKLQNDFTVKKLVSQLNMKVVNSQDAKAKEQTTVKHSDHPLYKDRIAIMDSYEKELRRSAAKVVPRRYFSDIASTAYLDLWPGSYVYDVSLNAGTALAGKTDFRSHGDATDGFLYSLDEFKNYHVGLSIDRFRWDKPWQTGLDLQWSQHQYGTTISSNEGVQLVERLKVNYVNISPKLTWSSIGNNHSASLRSLRVGFLAGIGVNVRVPAAIHYTNFVSNPEAPELAVSVSPKVTVGAAFMRKSFLPRGFKILFSYDPQWIRLKSDSNPFAMSHNLECTLQYSIFRW